MDNQSLKLKVLKVEKTSNWKDLFQKDHIIWDSVQLDPQMSKFIKFSYPKLS